MNISQFDSELFYSQEINNKESFDENDKYDFVESENIDSNEFEDEKEQDANDSPDNQDSQISQKNNTFDDIYQDMEEKDSLHSSEEISPSGSTGTPLSSSDSSNPEEEINSDGSSIHDPTVQDINPSEVQELLEENLNFGEEDQTHFLHVLEEPQEPEDADSQEVSDALYRLDRLTKGGIRGYIAVVLQIVRKEMKEYQKEHNKGKPNSKKINLRTNASQFAKFFSWYLSDRLSLNLTQQAKEDLYAVVVYLTFKTKFIKMIDPKLSRSKKQQIKREKEKFFRFNLPGNALGQDRDYSIAHVAVSFGKFLTEQSEEAENIFWSKVMGRKNNKFDDPEKFKESMSDLMDERVTPIAEYLSQ